MIKSNVKLLMYQNRVSIRALAAKTGLSTLTIQRARSDQIVKCTLDTLVRIAECLHVSPERLFVIERPDPVAEALRRFIESRE